jgi:hypothetical protein
VAQTPLAAVGLLTPAPRSAATTAHAGQCGLDLDPGDAPVVGLQDEIDFGAGCGHVDQPGGQAGVQQRDLGAGHDALGQVRRPCGQALDKEEGLQQLQVRAQGPDRDPGITGQAGHVHLPGVARGEQHSSQEAFANTRSLTALG